MNFSENWYTSSHWHKNNTGKVSWTSEVWFKRYEKVLNRQTNRLHDQVHLIVTDENFSSGTKKALNSQNWPKLVKILQNSKTWFIFHKKSQSLVQFTQLWWIDMDLAKKQPVTSIGSLQGTQNGQKRPQNDPFYAISKIYEK